MAIKRFKRFLKGIVLRGESSNPNEQVEGSLYHNSTTSELGTFLDGQDRIIITNDQTQTLENKTIDADQNMISNIRNDEIAFDAEIDATKIADGSVDNNEFQALDGVTSNIQTQIDSKASQGDLDAHINNPTDAHEASAIEYDNSTSGLTATNVQAAIDELDSGKMAIDGITSGTNITITGSGTTVDPYVINSSGGGGGSGSGSYKISYIDPVSTTLPVGTTVTIDGQSGINGDQVLFTNLTIGNNRVYELSGVGVSLDWTPVDCFNNSYDPSSGDTVRVTKGDSYKDQLAVFTGSKWSVNNVVRYFNDNGNYWEQSAIHTISLVNDSSDDVFSVNVANSENWVINYSAKRSSKKEIGTIHLTSNGTDVDINNTSIDGDNLGLSFSASILSGVLTLSYTLDDQGSDAEMKFFYQRWSDQSGGPGGVISYSGATSNTTIDIEQNGTPVLSASKLNFVSGAVITDGGSGKAEITISGGGGSINPGTPGTLPKYDSLGTDVEDSSINEDSTYINLNKPPVIKDSEIYFNDGTSDRLLIHTTDQNGPDRSLFTGYNSGSNLTNGTFNTSYGHYSLENLTSGSYNTVFGRYAGANLTWGTGNVYIGDQAGQNRTSGLSNIAIGRDAMRGSFTDMENNSGGSNIAIGQTALDAVTTGESNVAIGGSALGSNTKGGFNVAIGRSALSNYNGTANIDGFNIAIGYDAGSSTGSNTYGNIFIGPGAGPVGTGVSVNRRLYINPSSTTDRSDTPLIYGEGPGGFSSSFVRINNYIQLPETTAPATPPSGHGSIYVKSDGLVYFKNDEGTEYSLTGGVGGANTSLSNLTSPTAINQDLLPDSDSTYNIGSYENRFLHGYFDQVSIGTIFGTTFTESTSIFGGSVYFNSNNVFCRRIIFVTSVSNAEKGNIVASDDSLVIKSNPPDKLILRSDGRFDGPTQNVEIITGDASSLSGNYDSGNISLSTGSPAGSGTRGKVVVNARSLKLPTHASDPSSGEAGDIYYNTTSNVIRFHNGTSWGDI